MNFGQRVEKLQAKKFFLFLFFGISRPRGSASKCWSSLQTMSVITHTKFGMNTSMVTGITLSQFSQALH